VPRDDELLELDDDELLDDVPRELLELLLLLDVNEDFDDDDDELLELDELDDELSSAS
jgi:hypothetical protein